MIKKERPLMLTFLPVHMQWRLREPALPYSIYCVGIYREVDKMTHQVKVPASFGHGTLQTIWTPEHK